MMEKWMMKLIKHIPIQMKGEDKDMNEVIVDVFTKNVDEKTEENAKTDVNGDYKNDEKQCPCCAKRFRLTNSLKHHMRHRQIVDD